MTPDEIAARLATFPLFRDLAPDELGHLAGEVQEETYPAGMVIFPQGEPGRALLIVESGEVEQIGLDADGRQVIRRDAGPGQALGRTAILRGTVQPTTATTRSDVRLFAIYPQTLSWLLGRRPGLRAELIPARIAGRLRAFPCFASLPDEAILRLADLVHPINLHAGERIVAPEELSRALYLIDTGQAEVEYREGDRAWRETLTAGNFLGAGAILGETSPARARARSDLSLLRLDDANLRWLLRVYPDVRGDLRHPDIVGRLRAVPLFSALSDRQLAILAGYAGWHHYPARRMVTLQGEPGAQFFILDKGEAIARLVDDQGRGRPHTYFRAGDSFGQTSLFLGDTRDASVEALTPTDWLSLHRLDLQLCLADHPDLRPRLKVRADIQERSRHRRFRWQEPGELILFWARRHWFFLLQRMLVPVVLLYALVIAWGLALGWRAPLWLDELLLVVTGCALLAVAWVVIDWANDYFAVSNRRITHFERVLLLSEMRRDAPLDKVQDMNIARGLLGNILGFGTLVIQTAATVGKITFDHLAEPEQVQEIIFEQVARARASARAVSRGTIRRGLEHNLAFGLEPDAPARVLPDMLPPVSTPTKRPWRERLRFWPRLHWAEGGRVTWRKHWMNLLIRIIRPLLLTAMSLAGSLAALAGLGPFVAAEVRAPVFLVFLLLFLVFAAWLWWNYADWENDVYVVTPERIIDIEKKPLFFAENKREASLAVVQNVSLNIPGPLAYLLNYGDVVIQTAAETGSFNFRFVSNPRAVQNEIFRRIEAYRRLEDERRARERQSELLGWFGEYDRLKGEHQPSA
ncbi:MAG: cyclic nucleotide-binding domain-containing protein [Anaerolineae bacterium]|nr:cyclic nucleotide-binding domain-containing protein [Anaerolineae bacterium]